MIVDASVIAKCYLPETDSDLAEALYRDQPALAAPAIIRLEVASAITRRVRHKTLDAADAKALCDTWFKHLADKAITLVEDAGLLPLAVDWSIRFKHPLADCLYLAAAQSMDSLLVTADTVFYERAHKHSKSIRLLESMV